jgi:sugar phosphate isomerase/epimerase
VAAFQVCDVSGDSLVPRPWPFEGKLNWPAFIEKLTLAAFKGPLVFETEGGNIEKAHEVRERLMELRAAAENSIEEFRLKYRLPGPRRPGE